MPCRDPAAGQSIGVASGRVHPDFVQAGLHDVAVLNLASPTNVQPVAVATPDENNATTGVGALLRVAGYGAVTPFGLRLSPFLKTTFEQVRTDRRCLKAYTQDLFAPESMICSCVRLRSSSRVRVATAPGSVAADGVAEVDIGMAHRGRLSVITHVVDRPYEEVLREFEQAEARGVQGEGDVTGDVKYHQGASGTYRSVDGKQIGVTLANNPSHLEAVDGVVEGKTRAVQTDRSKNVAALDTHRAVAVLIHGDAAFPAQGTVAETLNLSALPGYTTGGTIHIIANNQIGFTTTPEEGRSTRYASDLAKGFELPVIHVNADDVEACIAAMRLAVSYREQFGRDAVIDLIGYRRFGHNETDEPAYTQPLMYQRIRNHPPVRHIFARRLSDGAPPEGGFSEITTTGRGMTSLVCPRQTAGHPS